MAQQQQQQQQRRLSASIQPRISAESMEMTALPQNNPAVTGGGGGGPKELRNASIMSQQPLPDVAAMVDGHPQVDLNFPADGVPLDYGNVKWIEACPPDQVEQTLKNVVTKPSCGSSWARGCTAFGLALLPVFGWVGLLCKAKYVKNDEISLAKGCDGSVYVLARGCHVHNTLCRKVQDHKITDDIIIENPVNLIRVLPGTYGIAENNGEPVILTPGRHFINDALFQWKRSVAMTVEHVKNGTTHIITVPGGKLGLVQVLGIGHILEPGRHAIDNNNLLYCGMANAADEYVNILAKHRVMIPVGRMGLAWDGGDARLLNSGQVYFIDNNLFKFVKSVSILDPVIEHGSIKIITVNEGLLGVAFDDGELQILPPGRHIVDKPTFMFSAFLSTGQETLPIRSITSLSSDNVGLNFSAAFTIQVVDAKKAVTMLGRDLSGEIEKRTASSININHRQVEGVDLPFNTTVFQENIKDRARLNLSIIIGNNKFTDSFLSTAALEGEDDEPEDQGESFKGLVHDAFMEKFALEMIEDCGVKILDMSIQDIRIISRELSQALAQAAVKATELEMARIDNDVEVTRAATEMKSLRIRAEGAGEARKIKASAESEKVQILGTAQANRIAAIDAEMSKICDASSRREMILSSAETLKNSDATLVFSSKDAASGILMGNIQLGGGKRGGRH